MAMTAVLTMGRTTDTTTMGAAADCPIADAEPATVAMHDAAAIPYKSDSVPNSHATVIN